MDPSVRPSVAGTIAADLTNRSHLKSSEQSTRRDVIKINQSTTGYTNVEDRSRAPPIMLNLKSAEGSRRGLHTTRHSVRPPLKEADLLTLQSRFESSHIGNTNNAASKIGSRT